MEFPARQVYSPESFKDTFFRVKTSISLSVVLKPAVWTNKCDEKLIIPVKTYKPTASSFIF